LAKQLFGEGAIFLGLSAKNKRMVLCRETILYAWQNDHHMGSVFSAKCLHEVPIDDLPGSDGSCAECRKLYQLHVFQNTLNRPIPNEENWKFTPEGYQCLAIGKHYLGIKGARKLVEADNGHSPWFKFGQGVVDGEYASQEVVTGMVQVLVARAERTHLGKSMKNMAYPATFSAFLNSLASLSTVAYKAFKASLPARCLRSI
jgi:hypothetical protein